MGARVGKRAVSNLGFDMQELSPPLKIRDRVYIFALAYGLTCLTAWSGSLAEVGRLNPKAESQG